MARGEVIRIRRAVAEDINIVTEIERQCFSQPWSYQSFIFELESRDAWFSVAECDGMIVGFAIMHRLGDDGEVFNIAVAEPYRRRGVGSALMENVLKGAEKLHVNKLFLEVRKSNESAQALYKKYGFQVCGLRRNYYDDPKEDAILMDAQPNNERGKQ